MKYGSSKIFIEENEGIESRKRPKAGQDASPVRSEAQGWVLDKKTAQGLKARSNQKPKRIQPLVCHASGLTALSATPRGLFPWLERSWKAIALLRYAPTALVAVERKAMDKAPRSNDLWLHRGEPGGDR